MFLLFVSCDEDGIHAQSGCPKSQGYAGVHGAKLFCDNSQIHYFAADAVIFFGDQDGKEVALTHHLHDIPGEYAFLVIVFGQGFHLFIRYSASNFLHFQLIVTQKVIHVYLLLLLSFIC